MKRRSRPPRPLPRRGITLLEVLIACGVLVIGLSSVAALMPAAGSLLGEATALDRAATLAANAAAELEFAKTVKAASFTDQVKNLLIGDMFPNQPPFNDARLSRLPGLPRPPLDPVYGRIWFGATAAPLAGSGDIAAGMAARLTIVIFRGAEPDLKAVNLSSQGSGGSPLPPGVFRLADGTPLQQEADRKLYLPPCAWVLAVNDGEVRWLHVGSSWTTYGQSGTRLADKDPAASKSYVSFTDPEAAAAAAASGNLAVHAFAGTLRVEERFIRLQG
jgi:hypothetical protein